MEDQKFPHFGKRLNAPDVVIIIFLLEECCCNYHSIHSLFVAKCARLIWTSEENDENQALVVNLHDGSTEFVDKENMDKENKDPIAVRLVRAASSK